MNTKKSGLGRGLEALIKSGGEPVRSLPVDQLVPNRKQPRTRFDEDGLEELAQSIRAQGIVQPLVVTPNPKGGYTIVAGERRWRAARRAGLESVPVVVREQLDERQLLELALVENLQRSDLNPLEEAEAYAALQEQFGLGQEDIAKRVGKSRPTITNALRLLKLQEVVRDFIRAGALTAGQARPLLGLESPEAQIALARRAIEEGLSARELEAEVAGNRKRPAKRAKPQEVHAEAAAEKLTQRLQTKVEIARRGRGGVVRIHFHSEEELMRLYDLLTQRGGKA